MCGITDAVEVCNAESPREEVIMDEVGMQLRWLNNTLVESRWMQHSLLHSMKSVWLRVDKEEEMDGGSENGCGRGGRVL